MRILDATWLNTEGELERGTLYAEDGRWIAAPGPTDAGESIDAKGLLVLPGLVDAHVHFREPGVTHKEGILSGSAAALAGGVTTVLEMPNTVPPCATPEALAEKRALYTQKCPLHWGLHYQATFPLAPLPGSPVASAKIYMAKSSVDEALTSDAAIDAIFAAYRRVAVHAEDETGFCSAVVAPPGQDPTRVHHLRRPVEAITKALDTLERGLRRMKPSARPRLVLCHAATREEIAWVTRLKREGFDVWAETCPHYLLLTQDDYVRIGNDLKVNPPLRTVEDREAVLAALADGVIDFISTDHAPHLPAEKAVEEGAPSGIASIECFLPLLLTLVESRKLSLRDLLRLAVTNAARCYELPHRGAIAPGNFADAVLLSTGDDLRPHHGVLTKAGVHPYLATRFGHRVESTLVAGVERYRKGAFRLGPGKEVYA